MCEIWGIAQGWWTVVGLVGDILGFALLAVDVLREYRRYRTTRELERGADAADWIAEWLDKNDADLIRKTKDLPSDEDEAAAELQELRRGINEGFLRLSEVQAFGYKGYVRESSSSQSYRERGNALRITADERVRTPFKRGPIYTGVALVLIGFALQVVGAMPC